MNKTENESGFNRIVGLIILLVVLVFLITNSAKLIQMSNDVFVVENGTLSLEETVEGYIMRDEKVFKGENYKNGMVQIKTEGEKVSNGDSIFRYYSSGEDSLNTQITELDNKINEALEECGTNLFTADVINLEKQIEDVLNDMKGENDLIRKDEYIKKIDNYITKKANIAGEASPAGSYIKDLINQRNSLKQQLNQNSEIIATDRAGLLSYRVDGMEEILGVNDFSNLNKELFSKMNLDLGSAIPQNSECGKVVNNFYCYIACLSSTENAHNAKVGDKVNLRLSNSTEVLAEVEYIVEDGEDRIIVFKIRNNVESLIEYRKVSIEIIWWKYSGWKISNQAIIEENDLSYVYKNKAGYTDKVLVKVLRQNDTFSIVTNYTKEELKELGFSEDEITEMPDIKVYDEILISK